jgi:hypothetical protein
MLKAGRTWAAAVVVMVASTLSAPAQEAQDQRGTIRWTPQKANEWYEHEPWLIGSNYLPADAINQLEMWQAKTFNPKRIDLELGWAQGLGMNTMRVFLHDLVWAEDPEGFKKRIDTFLNICQKHNIRPMLVLFDSCWDPFPKVGRQRKPRPGVHNSGWVQSPGAKALTDPAEYPRLEAYVKGVVGAFANDQRILAWDVWNEPDNTNGSSYVKQEPPNKLEVATALLPKTFAWARAAHPTQPLTSGVWHGELKDLATLDPMSRWQLDLSDIISFHNYGVPSDFEAHMKALERLGRPLICTEYMARGEKSTFEGILPIAKADKVGAINWGFVAGKSQTFYPWDSWQQPYVYRSLTLWFHDIFRENGRPYKPEEVAFIRKITAKTD